VLDNSGVPLATMKSTRQTTPHGTAGGALTTSTKAWDGGTVAARQNSHAYVTGDVVKVTVQPQPRLPRHQRQRNLGGLRARRLRVAVDGDTIVDSGVTWTAGRRYKLQSTFTPAVKGIIRTRVLMQGVGPGTFGAFHNLDPKISIA
jgi:hypothetical protein